MRFYLIRLPLATFCNTCVGANLVFAQMEINRNILNRAGQGRTHVGASLKPAPTTEH
jgi:hypothetical protein